MDFKKVEYANLNGKQKEIFNFQTTAGKLAKYGFNCIKLADDWNGVDFLAYHYEGVQTLKVQLKSRVTVAQAYIGQNLFMAFPVNHRTQWCLIEHDNLVTVIRENVGEASDEISWSATGTYHMAEPSVVVLQRLSPYLL